MDLCQQLAAMVNGVYLYMYKVLAAEFHGFTIIVTMADILFPLSYLVSPLYEAMQCV